jgi:hypothetical protein
MHACLLGYGWCAHSVVTVVRTPAVLRSLHKSFVHGRAFESEPNNYSNGSNMQSAPSLYALMGTLAYRPFSVSDPASSPCAAFLALVQYWASARPRRSGGPRLAAACRAALQQGRRARSRPHPRHAGARARRSAPPRAPAPVAARRPVQPWRAGAPARSAAARHLPGRDWRADPLACSRPTPAAARPSRATRNARKCLLPQRTLPRLRRASGVVCGQAGRLSTKHVGKAVS